MRTNKNSTARENLQNSPPVLGDVCNGEASRDATEIYNGEREAIRVLRPGQITPAGYVITNSSSFVLSLNV